MSESLWVIKLGGSLAGASDLRSWLAVPAGHQNSRVIVVPGGGEFANVVRAEQTRWGFDDNVAHQMALQAMDQFGRMLLALESTMVPLRELDQASEVWADGRTPVWLPSASLATEALLPASWDCTADTVAAWAAVQLAASDLILGKSAPLNSSQPSFSSLVEQGIVDPLFPVWASDAGFRCWYCRQPAEFAALLSGRPDSATRVGSPVL